MSELVLKKNNQYIEVCEMNPDDLAGRVKIKMSSHVIHDQEGEWNSNGITWLEDYTLNNIKSAIGMDYVVSWFDEENQIPSGHGAMFYDEDGNVQFDGVVVGSVQDAYITEVEFNGETKKVMMTEGYINSQRYGKFVKWLKEEIKNGTVYGSIEINGKGKSKAIKYLNGGFDEDGNLKVGRIPTIFDFTGLAILYIEDPADQYSQVFEINSKGDLPMKKNNVEINELNVDDIGFLVMKRFMEKYRDVLNCWDYYIHRFFPESKTIILKNWEEPSNFLKFTYQIENNNLTISDAIKAEEDWKPTSGEQSIEVNELNQLIAQSNFNSNNKGGNNVEEIIKEKDAKIAELNSKVQELTTELENKDNKIAELNTTVVEVNKTMQTLESEKENMVTEINSLREFKVAEEAKAKQTEINEYFKNEIVANGFTQEEINSLKEYVDKVDLVGLKSAEAELCVKKLKELNKKDQSLEINSSIDLFFAPTKQVKESEVELTEAAKLFK